MSGLIPKQGLLVIYIFSIFICQDCQVRKMPELEFTESELEAVTMVFKHYETGLREACIDVKDLLPALVSLGLNMMEQEVIDMTNTVARNGLVF